VGMGWAGSMGHLMGYRLRVGDLGLEG
jgi:hypothetical protein